MTQRINFRPVVNLAATSIIGQDDQVSADQFSNSAKLDLKGNRHSGEIVQVHMTMSGTVATLNTQGDIIFLSADPAVSAGDASLTAAEWETVIGTVSVTTAEWVSIGNAGVMSKSLSIPFHPVDAIWVVFLVATGETQINSAAGDNEVVKVSLQIRKESD